MYLMILCYLILKVREFELPHTSKYVFAPKFLLKRIRCSISIRNLWLDTWLPYKMVSTCTTYVLLHFDSCFYLYMRDISAQTMNSERFHKLEILTILVPITWGLFPDYTKQLSNNWQFSDSCVIGRHL